MIISKTTKPSYSNSFQPKANQVLANKVSCDKVSFSSNYSLCRSEFLRLFRKHQGERELFSEVDNHFVDKLAKKITSNLKTQLRIGITGKSGGGKSHFVEIFENALLEKNKIKSATIKRDQYIFDYSKQSKNYVGGAIGYSAAGNIESAKCVDFKRIKADFKALEEGKTIYPKKRHRETGIVEENDMTHPIESAPIIIAEGVSLFKNKGFLNSLDISIYVDAPEKLIRQRWFERAPERGKTGKVAKEFYQNIASISNKNTVPFKNCSDLVLNSTVSKATIESFSRDFSDILKKYGTFNS